MSAASAVSSSPRMRLLLITSSASAGSAARGAGDRIEALAVLDHEHLVAGDLHRIVGQGLDEGRGLVVGRGDGLVERLDARVGLADGDGVRLGRA